MKKNKEQVFYIDPLKIDVMENFNKRVDFGDIDELAAQIKEQGLLEAITVIPYKKDENSEERYYLVNGERRYRALMKLVNDGEDVGTVKAFFVDMDNVSDADLYIQQYMRNEGKKFNDIEFGRVCKVLKDSGLSNNDIAKKLGKNPGVITYALQALDYDPRIVEMMENGEIGGSEVRRMYTAARKKYGDDWEEKANEEIIKMKSAAVTEDDKPVKLSIKNNDLYGDVKDTKTFVAGIKILKQYIEHYTRNSKGIELEIDVFDMMDKLSKNTTLTLRELFDEAVQNAYKENA
jgi:ParB family chromosome partitioning protein